MAFQQQNFCPPLAKRKMSHLSSALSQDLSSRAVQHGSVCAEDAQTRVLNGLTYLGFAICTPPLGFTEDGHHWKFENQWRDPHDSVVAWHITPLQNLFQSCHYAAGSQGILGELAMRSGCNGQWLPWAWGQLWGFCSRTCRSSWPIPSKCQDAVA